MIKKTFFWLSAALYSVPLVVAAQTDATTLVGKIKSEILTPIIGLIGAAALAYFIWGVGEFVYYVDSEEHKTKGKQHMLWGLIGLAIIISVFGILNVVCGTINGISGGGCS